MTGQVGYGIPRATKIAEYLRKMGHDLVVPHEILHGGDQHENPDYSHADYIRGDVKLGMLADGVDSIALVDGWTQSKGCMAEFGIAVAMGYRVYQVVEQIQWSNHFDAYLIPIDGKGGW
jgi:hypothetical protein